MLKNEIKKVSIIGAGAVGCFYGTKLQKNGFDVQFQSKFLFNNHVNQLKINSIWGNFDTNINIHETVEKLSNNDLIIFSTKITDFENDLNFMKHSIQKLANKNSIILLLQNGINIEEKLQQVFPVNPILGGLAFTCINRNNNIIDHIDYGNIKIGANLSKYNFIAKHIVEIFKKSGIETDYLRNLRLGRYEKLLWNIPFNSLSVILNCTTEKLVLEGSTKNLARNLMLEVIKIAKKDGIPLKKSMVDTMINRTISMKPYKTSMLLDYEKGNKLEIESILKQPINIAKSYNIKIPYIDCIYHLLSAINYKLN